MRNEIHTFQCCEQTPCEFIIPCAVQFKRAQYINNNTHTHTHAHMHCRQACASYMRVDITRNEKKKIKTKVIKQKRYIFILLLFVACNRISKWYTYVCLSVRECVILFARSWSLACEHREIELVFRFGIGEELRRRRILCVQNTQT